MFVYFITIACMLYQLQKMRNKLESRQKEALQKAFADGLTSYRLPHQKDEIASLSQQLGLSPQRIKVNIFIYKYICVTI